MVPALTPPVRVVPATPPEVTFVVDTSGTTLAATLGDAATEGCWTPAGAATAGGATTRSGLPGKAGLGNVPDSVPTRTRAVTRPRPTPTAVWRYIGSERSRGRRSRIRAKRSVRAAFGSIPSDAVLGSKRPRRPVCVILAIGLLLTSPQHGLVTVS